MPAFHPLRVAEVRPETDEAVSIRFDVPAELAEEYRYACGQHLSLRTWIDGEEVRRTYSVCAGLDDGELRVAVKRMPHGLFSTWATTQLTPGDVIDVMTPAGRFTTTPDPSRSRVAVGIVGGSGITPVMSILRTVLAREPGSVFTLVYGNRSVRSTIFREQLDELKARYLTRLQVVHVLEQPQLDVPLLSGRMDAAKLHDLLPRLRHVEDVDEFYVCGPEPMVLGARAALDDLGVYRDRVHVEHFDLPAPGAARAAPTPPPPGAERCAVTVVVNGTKNDVRVAPGQTVLDAALAAGLDLPFSCRGGVCATCRAKLCEGDVEMAANYALEPAELAAGFVLTCQATPTTDHVVVDYDQT